MAFDCIQLGDSLYQNEFGELDVLLAPDSALEILPGGEGVGGLSVVTEQRTVAPVAFSAYSTSVTVQTAVTAAAVAQYATEDFDLGNDYNTATYTFTAPIAGVYVFSHQAFFDALGTGAAFEFGGAWLYKNGSAYSRSLASGSSADYGSDIMATLCSVMDLAAGDTVQPFVSATVSNALIGGSLQMSFFCGSLIKAT